MTTHIHSEDDVAARAPKLSDEDLANFDVTSALANVDMDDARADASDLRAVTEAYEALERSRAALDAAVSTARAQGRSWARIGGLLGVTRQAVQHRFRHLKVT